VPYIIDMNQPKTTGRFSPHTTSELWDRAHCALAERRWSAAVGHLEALMGRADNADLLSDAKAYGAPAHLVQYLQDRIDACNRHV
jgi:hypothetical protein